jgi:acyl carrier protein
MTGHDNIQERIFCIIIEQLAVIADDLTPDAQFIGDLGANELDVRELFMAIDEEWDIDEKDSLQTVAELQAYVFRRLAQKNLQSGWQENLRLQKAGTGSRPTIRTRLGGFQSSTTGRDFALKMVSNGHP